MIKVVNVITDSNIGGAGLVLVNFMRNTDKNAFSHSVILPKDSLLIPRLRETGVDILELDGIAERSFSPGAITAFRRAFAELKPDVVHTHASLSARIAARLYGRCGAVHTRHCAFDIPRFRTVFPLRQLQGLVNNSLSDVIIAISPAARDNLTDMGTAPRKIVTMMNGVEPARTLTDAEKAAVRQKYGVSDGELVCVLAARLEPYKGHEYVLEAAETLRGLPIKFLLAGTGSMENELREKSSAMGLQNCVFTGFVPEIWELHNIADIQLNASYGTETSSLALLEGMSLGAPSVVSDFGGNPSLIEDGENGFVVPRRNGAALADAIRRLHDDTETRARISRRAKEIYEERFTASAPVKKVEEIYRALAVGATKRKEWSEK
ncbi:MAG: glycosyltransferase [Oscillospiraceae bacterium]|jgi:glycosyltransferase involved in cell wall biosynthesis|nr:glycosyltransferase [Oscillospiraceae bacterium]